MSTMTSYTCSILSMSSCYASGQLALFLCMDMKNADYLCFTVRDINKLHPFTKLVAGVDSVANSMTLGHVLFLLLYLPVQYWAYESLVLKMNTVC